MQLENVVFDAREPRRLGRFWEAALHCETLTDEPAGFETRLLVDGGPVLDLCFQRVPDPPTGPSRLRLELAGPVQVDRLVGLGARLLEADPLTAGVAVEDPEGLVVGVRAPADDATGPLAVIGLDSADPERDAEFWSWLTGWVVAPGGSPASLRHPSLRGAVLELRAETARKGPAKNRVHLDVRLEPGEDADAVAQEILGRGGAPYLRPEWGELPWRSYTDPSGNELCVLPASS